MNDATGKLDRKKLPSPSQATVVQTVVSKPTNSQEGTLITSSHIAHLARLWEELLPGVAVVSRQGSTYLTGCTLDDSFFEIGGHSLLAARLTSKINAEFGVELEVSAIASFPTLRQLAQHLFADAKSVCEEQHGVSELHLRDEEPEEDSLLARIHKDCQLDPSVFPGTAKLAGYSRHRFNAACQPPQRILVTGGAYLFCLGWSASKAYDIGQ